MGLWVPPLSLGNQVWKDVNDNGVIDAGEVGVNPQTRPLRDGERTVVQDRRRSHHIIRQVGPL